MERQLGLNLECVDERIAALRNYLEPLNLPARAVEVLCLISAHGTRETIQGQQASRLSISKQNAAAKMGCAPNTFVEGANDLRTIGVLDILATTRPTTYFVNWSRVGKLAPPPVDDPLPLALFDAEMTEVWSASVSVGQGARDSVSISNSKIRVPCNVNRVRDTGALTDPDQVARPWAQDGGLTDDELVRAVAFEQIEVLRRLFWEAVQLGWIKPSDDAKVRFLTACHHCATCAGLNYRMAGLVARMKRGIDVKGTRHASEEWANELLRKIRRGSDPVLEEAEEERQRSAT